MSKNNKLSSKTKILIAVLTLSVFVIAGVVSLVLVLAASQQNVTSNIRVTYISNNVSATVTGKYWYTGASKTTMGTTTFNAGDVSDTRSMSPADTITLTTQNKRVVFEYAFTNLSASSAFTIELTNSPKITADGEQTSDYLNMTESYYVSAVEVPVASFGTMTLSDTLNVQPVMKQAKSDGTNNDTVYIYVVATISNLANNAAYNGTFAWELNYVAPANINTVTLNNEGGSASPATIETVQISGETVNMPCIYTFPTLTNKGFAGYYDAASEGTKYISFNGSPVHVNDLNFTSDVTLYADWSDYNINPQGVLVGYSGNETTLDVPEDVTALGANVFQGVTTIEEVNLPATLTEVGDNAFNGCTNLEEINFDVASGNKTYTATSNLTRVGAYAFKNCVGLTSIEIPGTATLSANMFSGCTNLKNITAPIYSKSYISGLTNVSLTINGSGTSIENIAFYNCTGLTSVTIGNSITSIGQGAFNGCTGLTSLTIGSGVTNVSIQAFYNCTHLTEIIYNANILTDFAVGNNIFSQAGNNFSGITLIIGNNVTRMPANLFFGNNNTVSKPNITEIVIGRGLTSIIISEFTRLTSITVDSYNANYVSESGILYNKAKTQIVWVSPGITGSVTLPSTLTSLGNSAFSNCTGLTSITIPGGVTSLGIGAFYGCKNLASVTIGNGITVIPNNAFYNCNSLTSITIPSGVTSIGNYAFYNCNSLTSITIPSGVTSIGNNVFEGCSSLTSIDIPTSVTSFGSYVFNGCLNLKNITGPIYNKSVIEATNISNLNLTINGSGAIPNNAFSNCTYLTSVTIESGVNSIGQGAFNGCTVLTSLTIGSGVTSISNEAFYNCSSLTEINYNANISTDFADGNNIFTGAGINETGITVNIGGGVTYIPGYLFRTITNPAKVTSVILPNTIAGIGTYAFAPTSTGTDDMDLYYNGSLSNWCSNINFSSYWRLGTWTLYVGGTAVTNHAIPSGVTSIPNYAFYFNSGITSVTMADSVTSIGERAFMRCYNLQNVTIGAGVTTIGDRSFNDCTSLEKIYIPSTVTTVVNSSNAANKGILAESSTTAQIYTDAASKPAGWDGYFNYYDSSTQLTVNYGYTKQQFDALIA